MEQKRNVMTQSTYKLLDNGLEMVDLPANLKKKGYFSMASVISGIRVKGGLLSKLRKASETSSSILYQKIFI